MVIEKVGLSGELYVVPIYVSYRVFVWKCVKVVIQETQLDDSKVL